MRDNVLTEADEVAADYTGHLGSESQRAFARQYWLYLSRQKRSPIRDDVRGWLRIEQHLDWIFREYSHYAGPVPDRTQRNMADVGALIAVSLISFVMRAGFWFNRMRRRLQE